MRFLSKYELMEQLTLGKLETYSAHRIGGGERLLVHLFSLPTVSATELSNLELLQALERIAPLPPGPIVDAGRYDDGSQAFVVSKLPPEPGALQTWLESYRAQTAQKESTAELPELPGRSKPVTPPPPAPPESNPPPRGIHTSLPDSAPTGRSVRHRCHRDQLECA